MSKVKYTDRSISAKELMYAVASMVIGVGIFNLPRYITTVTNGIDGVISILVMGGMVLGIVWIMGQFVRMFPGKGIYEILLGIIPKPLALPLIIIYGAFFALLAAYEIRAIAEITKKYLLPNTSSDSLSLLFLLVTLYALFGSRTALIRINSMFLPVVLIVSLLLVVLNIRIMHLDNFYPLLTTDLQGYGSGMINIFFSFTGISIILSYSYLVNEPDKASSAAVKGVFISIIIYTLVFVSCVAVFSNLGTDFLENPTIELGKEIELPGGFFERFESVYFTIWIMTIFNTTSMSIDSSLVVLESLFKKAKKETLIVILSPIIFFVSMVPIGMEGIEAMGTFIGRVSLALIAIVPVPLYIIAKIRGVKS
ncbi:endospore germination permease [Fictibacillus sp. 7GRE50]|uniref:GerAB/ArcD/ProY family transporter n=1 Tax=Fictibacillus sp. 7GRE50 TaxID=2745878 RepID=UPI0018CE028B|nr:endospore germination permease [Fictibacillus sp. 7GRE50]